MEEVAIVNAENKVIGKADRRVMREYRIPHRATYIVIKNSSDLYYVQKRTATKDYCPSKLDPVTGGVVSHLESYKENAMRELKEELGIDNKPLTYLDTFYYEDDTNRVFGGLFELETPYDGPLTLQPDEVESVVMMTKDEILSTKRDTITPDGLHAFKHYLTLKTQ